MYAEPLASKDAVTVSTTLIRLFCLFGVCKTLISDNGTEFTAEVTKTVCRLFQVPQEFTPSYIHHCLGACERTHRTLAEKLTPYVHSNMSCWESVLPMIVFAMKMQYIPLLNIHLLRLYFLRDHVSHYSDILSLTLRMFL